MEVEVSRQVNDFVRCQHPESRHRLRLALRALSLERGDIKALEGPLTGLYRLRVGRYRVLYAYATTKPGTPVIQCIFAECRDVVYEVFEQLMTERLLFDRSIAASAQVSERLDGETQEPHAKVLRTRRSTSLHS